jgi:hypothetical protein
MSLSSPSSGARYEKPGACELRAAQMSKRRGLRIRLLSGPGGAGRTPLAAELAQSLRDDGCMPGSTPTPGSDSPPQEPKVCRLSAGGRWIRTSSTRAPCDGTESRICRCLPP